MTKVIIRRMRRRGPYAINAVRSTETAQVLRELADLAERGEVIGLAYVAIRPNRKVIAATAGVATADPPLVTHWLTKLSHILLKS